jgi:hypothetical protein
LWHACGRGGLVGDFLKGLIQLTAAGVKVRQGMPRGVAGLGQRAAELFRGVADRLGPGQRRFLGLEMARLEAFARELAEHLERAGPASAAPFERVLSLVLTPDDA